MNATVLLQTFDSVGTKIDSLWSMYIVVHLGLLWFFFLVHRPLLILERVVAWIGYGGFIYVNGGALLNTYTMLEAVRSDLVSHFAKDFGAAPETLRILASNSYDERLTLILFTHLGGVLLVFMLFAFRNTMITRYYRKFPEQISRPVSLTD